MPVIHPNRIFVGSSRIPPSLGSTRVGSNLAHNYVTMAELPVVAKYNTVAFITGVKIFIGTGLNITDSQFTKMDIFHSKLLHFLL